MQILESFFDWFFSLGSTVFVPIIMFVLSYSFGRNFSKSLRAGLYFGIGLVGLDLIINLAVEAMAPVTIALSERVGVDYSVIDIGYGNVSAAWSWPGVIWVIIGILVINIIMLSLKLTKTLWVDMWNIWHGQYIALLMWALTGSIFIGVASGLLLLVICMLLADYHANKIQEFNGIEGVSVVATSGAFTASFAQGCMKIIERIPVINDLNASPSNIKKKFGIFGESAVIGSVLGIIFGIIAQIGTVATLQLSIQLASVLVIIPKMLSLIAEAIIPISQSVTKFMKDKFPGRDFFIAVDPAILLGDPSVMSTVIIMYPISIFIAALLPGSNFLPIASLAVLPYWIGGMVPYTKGNVLHTVIIATLWIIPTHLVSSNLAWLTTEAMELTNLFADRIAAGELYSNWEEGGNFLLWLLVMFRNLFS